METVHEQPEVGKSFPSRLSLDDVTIDWDIYPRELIDPFTEEKYCDGLFNGVALPHPRVDKVGRDIYRIIDGVHTFKAYVRRRDMYRLQDAGERIGERLPDISEEELNTVLCVIEEIPEGVDPMLHCARRNMKHGKALTSGDYKKIARHLYSKWFGAPITKLGSELGIRWETINGYVLDLVAEYERLRGELILQLRAQGTTEAEIGQTGQERYPYGTGWSQSSISKFLAEHENSEAKDRKKRNGSSKVIAFRRSELNQEQNSAVGDEDPVEENGKTSSRGEGCRVNNRAPKEGLRTILCDESVMTVGLNYLHNEIRDPYVRALDRLAAITWAKELRLRERLKDTPGGEEG